MENAPPGRQKRDEVSAPYRSQKERKLTPFPPSIFSLKNEPGARLSERDPPPRPSPLMGFLCAFVFTDKPTGGVYGPGLHGFHLRRFGFGWRTAFA